MDFFIALTFFALGYLAGLWVGRWERKDRPLFLHSWRDKWRFYRGLYW